MALTKYTKVTQPIAEDIGTSVMIDDECYIKSTQKTSTWNHFADPTTGSTCDNGNMIKSHNINLDESKVYTRVDNVVAQFTGDWAETVDLVKNPYYDTSDDILEFKYNSTINRDSLVKFTSMKPHGFYYQAVVRLKQPIDIPAGANIKMTWTPENFKGPHGGLQGSAGQFAWDSFAGNHNNRSLGGVYSAEKLSDIPIETISWPNNSCGAMKHWRAGKIENTVPYIKEHGKSQANTFISHMLFGGCAGGKQRFGATLLDLSVTHDLNRILIEGEDF